MRRSITSAATERRPLGLALVAQLIVAVILVWPASAAPPVDPPAPTSAPVVTAPDTQILRLRDGRSADLIALGSAGDLLDRIAGEIDGAADAVTAFWGDDWPRRIEVVVAGSDEQFRALAAGAPDIAATTTAQRIMFAPRAAAMSAASLRIVLRHELFHYAARSATAADAPRWLTEGVADYVGRPDSPPPDSARLTRLPTDADLDATGPDRSLAYDRAWWFSRYVADRYGVAALRSLYVAACGVGHADVDTAVRETLHADVTEVLAGWRRWARS
jgi:hypothetical protein